MAKKGGDAKTAKKGRKGKGKPEGSPTAISVSAHPRAAYSISRLKGYGGLFGLLLVAFLSWRAGLPPVDAALRGLVGGIVAYVVCWALAVQVWRHLVLAEAAAAAEVVRRRREAALAAEGEA
jgi:hypothetical protein